MASRFVFLPTGAQFPTSAFPNLVRNSVGRFYLQFDQTLNESCYWTAVAPENFAGPANAIVTYSTFATSGAVTFTGNIEVLGSGNIFLENNFQAGGTVTATVPGTINTPGTITIPLPNVPPAGAYFRFRLRREGSAGTDTLSGDCNVLSVDFKDSV